MSFNRHSLRSLGLTSLHFFVFGLMMALGFGTVLAVPTATPPSGTVSPNFSSLNVSGTTTTADLNTTGTLTSTGNISINNDLLETQTINSVDMVTVGYSGSTDTQFAGINRNGVWGSIVSNENYGVYVWNNTTQASKGAIKGRVGSSAVYQDGYLGYVDSTGSYGLFTPNNAKVVGTFAVSGASTLNGAISSSTGSLNLNDDTAITGNSTVSGNATVSGNITVTGSSILNGNVSDSGGALVLNDDVQVGVTSTTYISGYVAKLFTGALTSVAYATHAEFGNFDIASTDDLFVDDKIFVGNTIEAGGDITAGDDLVSTDDVIAGDDITGGDVVAAGSVTGNSIGALYTRSAYVSLNTTGSFSFNLGCLEGDLVMACSGRTEETGAIYMGAKPVSGLLNNLTGDLGNASTYGVLPSYSTQGCEVFGAKGTATSGTDLNVYTFCFSPNG